MKRILRTVAIVLMCGALAVPAMDARGRNNTGNGGGTTHQPANRPGNSGRGSGQSNNSRPSNNNRNNNRPGNNNSRPGNNNNRPGNNNRTNNNGRPNNNRPSTPPRNDHHNPPRHDNHRPEPPRHNPHHGGHHGGPMRPNMPPPRPFYRPTPPPHGWHPDPCWHPIHSILGVTLGTAFNVTLNALFNSGYTINSYGNNTIYLDNVRMLNMTWPDATLFFNDAGGLYASRFVYSTSNYDLSRYNTTYSILVQNYGSPVSVQNNNNGIETTWWGNGGQFIRLAFVNDYANNGYMRYFTTLSFGN